MDREAEEALQVAVARSLDWHVAVLRDAAPGRRRRRYAAGRPAGSRPSWKLAVDLVSALDRGEVPRRGSLPQEPPETALTDLLLVDLLLESAGGTLD